MAPPKQLSKAEAEKLTMDIFGCNTVKYIVEWMNCRIER